MLMHNSIRVRLETSIQLADYFFSRAAFLSPSIRRSLALSLFLSFRLFLALGLSVCRGSEDAEGGGPPRRGARGAREQARETEMGRGRKRELDGNGVGNRDEDGDGNRDGEVQPAYLLALEHPRSSIHPSPPASLLLLYFNQLILRNAYVLLLPFGHSGF